MNDELQMEIVPNKEAESISSLRESLDFEVKEAQEQLIDLRHQQQLIEKQKLELEELSQKQETFTTGRNALIEKLNRALITLERETVEYQQTVEHFLHIKENLSLHLNKISSLDPSQWQKESLRDELTKALALIEDAEEDYEKSRIKMTSFAQTPRSDTSPPPYEEEEEIRDFLYWLKSGFAFTLPLLLLGILALGFLFFLFN